MKTRMQPIRVNDLFNDGNKIWRVIRVLPGGKLDLFCDAQTRFSLRYHREVKSWERVQL